MNLWIIAAIVIGILAITGVTVFAFSSAAEESTSCGSSKCTGKCTAENNCGSQICGAAQGKTCNCQG